MEEIFNSVDMDSVKTWVIAIGLVIVAIAMAFKGIDLAKRGVKKA